MKSKIGLMIAVFLLLSFFGYSQNKTLTANQIIEKMDENMTSTNRVSEIEMIVEGRRNTRTIVSKAYTSGVTQSFTEYLAPDREKGTKMLKLDDRLWIYSPTADKTIQLSGHLLRQSVMGSDLSYEDMMETRSLNELYTSTILGEEEINGEDSWVVELVAKVDDTAYQKIKMWVDKTKFVPVKQESYAKSGKLLKEINYSDVQRLGDRWFPMAVIYKDVLKSGNGTKFRFLSIEFDVDIPEYLYTKASLTK